MKDGIIRELKDVDHFSVITDMWSSVNMMPYMSLTIHYLSAYWELKSKCLETVFTPDSHTSDNLAEALRSSFQECSRLQRDAGQVGKKGREKPLCVAKARHAGSEPA